MKLTGTEFICQLPEHAQNALRSEIERIPSADVETAMSGRLCDLEDNLDWRQGVKEK